MLMKKKYQDTVSFMDRSSHQIMEAFLAMAQLKNLYRQGWLRRGVSEQDCESVADHSFGVALLGYVLANEYRPDLDAAKVMQLGLFHEIGEIYAGDVTPHDGISAEEKSARERQSAHEVSRHLPDPTWYLSIWEEFESRETPEAVFVGEVDKLEMLMQARLYELLETQGLDEFFVSVKERINLPELKPIVDSIIDCHMDLSDTKSS